MKLYSAWHCPFAQRVWMTLLHKQIEFDYVEVDADCGEEWWINLSRGTELVPVLGVETPDGGETSLVESTRILEFLDHYRPLTAPVYAADPLERAEQKYWIDHIGNHVTTNMYRLLKADEPGDYRDRARQNLTDGLHRLARAMNSEGPYFNGVEIGAVDVVLIPFAYRIDVLLKHYRDFELPADGDDWRRYRDWFQAMLALPAFRATSLDHADYQQRLIVQYLPSTRGRGWSKRNQPG